MPHGITVKASEMNKITDELDAKGIEWSIWNIEDVLFNDADNAELSVENLQDFEVLKSIRDEKIST